MAKILQERREHSPPTRDGQVSQSSESALSSKDLLNKHQANISRLANAFGLQAMAEPASEKREAKLAPGSTAAKHNRDLDDLVSIQETPKTSGRSRLEDASNVSTVQQQNKRMANFED